jgi:hypothetical protein
VANLIVNATRAAADQARLARNAMMRTKREREVPGTEDSQALSMQKVPILRAQK